MDRGRKYETSEVGIFNWSLRQPFAGIAGSEDETGNLVARIISLAVPELQWITCIIRSELELDIDDYAVYISGTPTVIAGVVGDVIGYSIHLSLYPRDGLEARTGNTELAGHPGMGD
jgi:hypothetical protein